MYTLVHGELNRSLLGRYSCQATNNKGTSTSSCVITEGGYDDMDYPTATVSFFFSERIILSCRKKIAPGHFKLLGFFFVQTPVESVNNVSLRVYTSKVGGWGGMSGSC